MVLVANLRLPHLCNCRQSSKKHISASCGLVIQKKNKSKREKSATACMLPLLAGIGERLRSKAPPDPGRPYTSKTSRHMSALLGELDCVDTGLQPREEDGWQTSPCYPTRGHTSGKNHPLAPGYQSYHRDALQIQHIPTQWGFSSVWWDILLTRALARQFHSAAFTPATWYQPPASPSLLSLILFLWK